MSSPHFRISGHMDFVDNRMDPNTGTMRGRAILRNPDFMLTPGLFARVRLPGSGEYDAVLIPDVADRERPVGEVRVRRRRRRHDPSSAGRDRRARATACGSFARGSRATSKSSSAACSACGRG